MQCAAVRLFSHHFTVRDLSPAFRQAVRSFASDFVQYKSVESGGHWTREVENYFFSWDASKSVYRFHINTFEKFKEKMAELGHYEGKDFQVTTEPLYQPVAVDFGNYLPPYDTPLPDQVKIVQQLEVRENPNKFLGLQTGGGKSYLSCVSMNYWGSRSFIHTKPAYLDKTEIDLKRIFKMQDGDILKITGGENLAECIRGIMMGYLNPKVILVSNKTFSLWISAHEALPDGELVPGFECTPYEFFQVCGIGHRIIDEAHQDFYMNYKLDLFTHCSSGLAMTATLITKDPFLIMAHEIAYPRTTHCSLPEYRRYAKVMAWYYEFMEMNGIRTSTWGKTSYNHIEFEKSIIKRPKILKAYLFMIAEIVRKTYRVDRKPGEKCLIWFSTTKMCEMARDSLKLYFPDLTISKFNQGDPYSNLMDVDICCATLGKAGTNVDIKNLTTAILTIAIDSPAANLQAFGRMRDNKKLYGSNRDPLFVYLVCNNIRKHKDYDKAKNDLLRPKSIDYTSLQHNVSLGFQK